MKTFIKTAVAATTGLALAAGVGIALTSSPALADDHTTTKPSANIVETAVSADDFNTLVAAVVAADLAEVLSGEGPFTVFAPTDEAFAALPEGTLDSLLLPENKEKLQGILTYHVVAGKVKAETVVTLDGEEVETVNGATVKVKVEDGKVFVNDAEVVKTDIVTSNGVIHVINAVILPPAE